MTTRPLRILLPLDGSSEAETILGAVLPLAERRPLRLTLFEAYAKDGSRSDVEAYLARSAAALRGPNLEVAWETCFGEPAVAIVAHSISHNADFIAMTTHGRSGVRRLLMGSVAEKVLRQATLPLVTCRPGSRMEGWAHVVALDGSARAETILDDVVTLTRTVGATLHLLHVASDPADREVRGYLKQVALQIRALGVEVATAVRAGSASTEILRYAAQVRAGVVALATHGRTGVKRVLMGSVAEEILRKSPCPVFLRRELRPAAPPTVGLAPA
jgi:nucleotide-binding universal stress UspA family protein